MRHLIAENKGSLRIIRPAKRRPLFARLIGSVTYVAIVVHAAVFAVAVVECCFANQINKWRRRKREKTNGARCDHWRRNRHLNRFAAVHALRSMRTPRQTATARSTRSLTEIELGKSAAKTEPRRQILFSRAISCGDGDEKGAAIMAAGTTGEDDDGGGSTKGGAETFTVEAPPLRARRTEAAAAARAWGCAVSGRRSRRLNGSSVICGSANRRKEGRGEQTVALSPSLPRRPSRKLQCRTSSGQTNCRRTDGR